MIRFEDWYLPDGEQHLQQWMTTTGRRRAGRLTYQIHKYEAALKYCTQRRVAVDVGAHVGLWSYWMAEDFTELIAFEPKSAHRECWRRNMEHRGGSLIAAALGNTTGRVSLTTGPSSSGDTYVDPTTDTGEVTLMRLDEFRLRDVDLIKVDCEGFEVYVLEGAAETLKAFKPVVIVEQKPGHGEKYGISDTAGVTFLKTLGYQEREVINGDFILTAEGA